MAAANVGTVWNTHVSYWRYIQDDSVWNATVVPVCSCQRGLWVCVATQTMAQSCLFIKQHGSSKCWHCTGHTCVLLTLHTRWQCMKCHCCSCVSLPTWFMSMCSDTDDGSVVFVHQTTWQQRMLALYGTHMCLIDATYKTTVYEMPLFFLCVPANVDTSMSPHSCCQTNVPSPSQPACILLSNGIRIGDRLIF